MGIRFGSYYGESASEETREAFRALYRRRSGQSVDCWKYQKVPVGILMAFGLTHVWSAAIRELVIKVDRMFSKKAAGWFHPSMNKRKMTVRECKPVIEEAEFDKLLAEAIAKEAVMAVDRRIISSTKSNGCFGFGYRRRRASSKACSGIASCEGRGSTRKQTFPPTILFIARSIQPTNPADMLSGVTRSITHSCQIRRFNQGRFTSV